MCTRALKRSRMSDESGYENERIFCVGFRLLDDNK